jgi:hypothetical protein
MHKKSRVPMAAPTVKNPISMLDKPAKKPNLYPKLYFVYATVTLHVFLFLIGFGREGHARMYPQRLLPPAYATPSHYYYFRA